MDILTKLLLSELDILKMNPEVEQLLLKTLQFLLNSLQVFIPRLVTFSREYPTVFAFFSVVLITYVAYRIFCQVLTIVKRLLFISCIILGLFIYSRGFDQFVHYDMPYLIKSIKEEKELQALAIQWLTYLRNTTVASSSVFYRLVIDALKNSTETNTHHKSTHHRL